MKIVLFLVLFLLSKLVASSETNVSVKLSWLNQFQFAGIIVAKEKGFYKDLGLNVEIKEFSKNDTNDTSEFVIRKSSAIIDSMDGSDIVALGASFQHSPMMLLVLESSGIKSPKDLQGKKIMVTKDAKNSAAIIAMLNAFKLDNSNVEFIPHSFKLEDLINQKTDAMACYISNEPLILDKLGIRYKMLKPSDYGFDFYEDLITVNRDYLKQNPKVVEDFYKATLKGWEYAYNNIDEASQIVFTKYNTQNKTLESLKNEGKVLKTIAYDPDDRLGVITNIRLTEMENVFQVLGLSKNKLDLEKFVYEHNAPPKIILNFDNQVKMILGIIFLGGVIVVLLIVYYTKKLHKEIEEKKIAQDEITNQKNFIQNILNKMENIVVISNQKTQTMVMSNKQLLRLLDLESQEEFINRYGCICKLFSEKSGYISEYNDGVYWIDYLLKNRENANKIMIQLDDKIHLFSVYTEYFDETKNLVMSVFTDITSLKAKDDQIALSNKNKSLMNMITNIAHHWRQPLSVISTSASSILFESEMQTLDDKKLNNYANNIITTSSELSHMLDIFGNKMESNNDNKMISVEDLIVSLKAYFVEPLAKNNIELYINADDDVQILQIPNILFDVQKEIIQNSIDTLANSLIEKKAIFVEISLVNTQFIVDIFDNGDGVKDEDLDKLFEPYFTTYHQSKGKGLGLYFVHNIVQNILFGEISAKNKNINFDGNNYKGLETTITIHI